MPGESGGPVVTILVCLSHILHARLRVHRAPGIPCALCFRKGGTSIAKLARIARRDREVASGTRGTSLPPSALLRSAITGILPPIPKLAQAAKNDQGRAPP